MTAQRHQFAIDLQPVFDALEKPLELVDDPERRRQFESFLANGRSHQEKAILALISDIVGNFNDAAGLHARVELQGGGYTISIEQESEEAPPIFDAEEVERVTVRLPKELKKLIDEAAERSGASTNTWYVRNLARTIARHVHMEHRVHGDDESWSIRMRGRRRRRDAGDDAGEAY
jgi:uncharacterized protein (DUF1778 family)